MVPDRIQQPRHCHCLSLTCFCLKGVCQTEVQGFHIVLLVVHVYIPCIFIHPICISHLCHIQTPRHIVLLVYVSVEDAEIHSLAQLEVVHHRLLHHLLADPVPGSVPLHLPWSRHYRSHEQSHTRINPHSHHSTKMIFFFHKIFFLCAWI